MSFLHYSRPTGKTRVRSRNQFCGRKTPTGRSSFEDGPSSCEWIFNPPHASYFGGVWERQIGTVCQILDAVLLKIGQLQLTQELLVTLMAEVTGNVNSRPIAAIPFDVDEPRPLTQTMKTRPLASPPGKFVQQNLYG